MLTKTTGLKLHATATLTQKYCTHRVGTSSIISSQQRACSRIMHRLGWTACSYNILAQQTAQSSIISQLLREGWTFLLRALLSCTFKWPYGLRIIMYTFLNVSLLQSNLVSLPHCEVQSQCGTRCFYLFNRQFVLLRVTTNKFNVRHQRRLNHRIKYDPPFFCASLMTDIACFQMKGNMGRRSISLSLTYALTGV